MLRSLTSTPQHLLRAPPKLGVGPPAQYFTEQKQDHFDPSSSRIWSQAFFVNDTFWRPGSDAPVFLCVGGEGPALDGSVVVASPHCNNAVEWLPETKAPTRPPARGVSTQKGRAWPVAASGQQHTRLEPSAPL